MFAVDPNLVDSDIFDSRTNMRGVVVSGNYLLSDAVTLTLTYANGEGIKQSTVTAGTGDIALATLKNFNLLQCDVVAKF